MLSKEEFLKVCKYRDRIEDFVNAMKDDLNIDITELEAVDAAYCLFDSVINAGFTEEQADFIFGEIFDYERCDYDEIYDETLDCNKDEEV